MQFTSKITAALVALASVTNAHMILRSPVPFNAPDNSPVNADGSNFPCKIAGGSGDVKSGPVNALTVGESFNFALTGGATHGGGSCQLSMAKGTSVNANTKWMVIYSIEGDCPIETSANGEGTNNDPSNAGSTTSNQFPVSIPDHPDLPAGDYTLAWTWNNKVGNRELYMNCAYVQLSAAKKKRYEPTKVVKKDQAPLPDMFVANIPQGGTCAVTANTDVLYPNPGDASRVLKGSKGATYNFQPPTGNCGGVAANAASGSSSAGSSIAASSVAASSSGVANTVSPVSSATVTAASSGTQSVSPGNFASVSSSGAASQATSAAASTTASAVATSIAATSATQASSSAAATGSGTTTVTGAQSGPCTNEGAWACAANGKSFQRCASGQWSVAMQMASGMTCVPGVSANFAMNAAGAVKRDARSHLSRRRHGAVLS